MIISRKSILVYSTTKINFCDKNCNRKLDKKKIKDQEHFIEIVKRTTYTCLY